MATPEWTMPPLRCDGRGKSDMDIETYRMQCKNEFTNLFRAAEQRNLLYFLMVLTTYLFTVPATVFLRLRLPISDSYGGAMGGQFALSALCGAGAA